MCPATAVSCSADAMGCSRYAAPVPAADRQRSGCETAFLPPNVPRAECDSETDDLILMQKLIAAGKGSAIYQWNMAVIF